MTIRIQAQQIASALSGLRLKNDNEIIKKFKSIDGVQDIKLIHRPKGGIDVLVFDKRGLNLNNTDSGYYHIQ